MNLKHATLKGSDPGRVLSATAVPAACRAGHHCRSRVLFISLFPSRPSNFHITVALPVIPHSPAVGGKGVACTLAAGWGQARRIFFPYNWISFNAAGACDFNPLFYHMAAGWIEIGLN